MEPVKITGLQEENFKRIRAVALTPSPSGLTVVGGRNGQGKTSVLDGICAALGGGKYIPTEPTRDGSVTPAKLRVTLSNGIVAERSGPKSALRITDPMGRKGGQKLLDSFVEQLALNLPKFMQASSADKAETLLKVIGVGPQLAELDRQAESTYSDRTIANRTVDSLTKAVSLMPYHEGAPEKPVSVSELIQEQQTILARNGENERLRRRAAQITDQMNRQAQYVKDLTAKLREAEDLLLKYQAEAETANTSAADLRDESTAELEASIQNAEAINRLVSDNVKRAEKEQELEKARAEADALSQKLEQIRSQRKALLDSAPLPLPGLSVEGGELSYHGKRWDGMSGSEQLRVSCAIVKALRPECGFVLMDGLEAMDMETLAEFDVWAKQEGLQIIATRVSSSGEGCTVVIEDGYLTEQTVPAESKPAQPEKKPPLKQWTPGAFGAFGS